MYNNLEAIRVCVIKYGDQEASDMIYMLALLFRNLFERGMIVDLSDKIDS